jgi:hypothetical protein
MIYCILGMMFVPSKFVRPPKEFLALYGPNIRQSRLESFYVSCKKETQAKKEDKFFIAPRVKRQQKIKSYFKKL